MNVTEKQVVLLSDLSSIGSVDQVTVMDSTFAAISAIPSPALVKHQKYLDTAGSVPHLDTRWLFAFLTELTSCHHPDEDHQQRPQDEF